MGKSTIARTVSSRYYNQKCLGASFFFSRGGGNVRTVPGSWRAVSNVSNRTYIYNDLVECRDIASQSLHDERYQLIPTPMLNLDGTVSRSSYALVIDTFNECDNNKHILTIMNLLTET